MTINFALSLSFQGIELLHRTSRGWRRLGRAEVGSPSMDADLAEMRQKAISLAPEGVATKLVIPADQIKYTAIDSTLTTDEDIAAKLDGTTPYALSDLVIDCERLGGRTHIAAVARETLAEAESFATAHGFNPVAFVAISEPFTFQKEVFFGPTRIMPQILGADATVARDDLPVMIVGTRLKSRLLVMDDTLAQVAKDSPDLSAAPAETAPPPAPAPEQAQWIDAIPPEYWAKPTPQEAVAPVTAPPRTTSLFQPALFDLVVPEVHQPSKPAPKPVLVATRPVSTPPAPKPDTVSPVAARKPSPTPAKAKPLGIAAAVALAAALGAVVWTQMAPADDPAPVIANTAIGENPQVPALAVAGLAAPETGAVNLPSLTPTQAPLPLAIPQTLTAVGPDATPTAPQLPPAPPAQTRAAATGTMPSPAEAEAFYAATGVWQRAARFFDTPSGVVVLGFTPPATLSATPRVAQPSPLSTIDLQGDLPFTTPANPPAPGVIFPRDENGFIAATEEGTVTPDGAIVFAGAPDITMTLRPVLSEDELARMALLAPAPEGVVVIPGPPDVQAPLRPADFAELAAPESPAPTATPPTAGAVGLASLELQSSGAIALDPATVEARAETDLRPQLRPNGLAPQRAASANDLTDILTEIAAEDATLRFDNSTSLAVRASIRPADRPDDFARIVAAAQPQQVTPDTSAAPVAVAAPVPPQNYAPVPGGVARAATQEDVIRLRDINLIGVYGRANARRALVRLSNGRYVRVEVGSALDGGQVTAIGDEALNYVKRGRTYAVEMPGN